MHNTLAAFAQLRERLGQSVIGQPAVIEALLIKPAAWMGVGSPCAQPNRSA